MFVEIELTMANQSEIYNVTGVNPMSGGPTNKTLITEPQAMRVIRILLYVVIFFVGVIGNILVLLVVYKTPSLRSVTGYMIANLAIADLMVALFCLPATLIYMELKTWPFGYAMCKIIPFVQAISVMGSVGTLTVISVDRYRCIVNTFAARLSMSVLRYLVCLIWSVALVIALPLLGVNTLHTLSQTSIHCVEKWPKPKYRRIYSTVSFALTYAIPLAIMCLLYIKIAIALNKVVKDGGNREGFTNQKKKDKVLRMLLALVIAYASCFLPNHVIVLWSEYGEETRYWLLLQYYAILLVYLNSASNPVLYAFMGNRFKDGFKRLLCCQKFPTFNRSLSRNNRQSVATREFGLSERSS